MPNETNKQDAEANKNLAGASGTDAQEAAAGEDTAIEEESRSNWREVFRTAFARARQQQKVVGGRQELGRDKSKSLFLLISMVVVLLLLFFSIFSRPKRRTQLTGESPHGQATLGRKVIPGQENGDPTKSVTPKLSADVRSTDPALAGHVTAEDVSRTSRRGLAATSTTPPAKPQNPQQYALGKVDFSNPAQGNTMPSPPQAPLPESNLTKPSLVFVRSLQTKPTLQPRSPEDEQERLALQAGTRLVARLQTAVSSAAPTPVIAVVEYNYERNGQIVLPAGAKVFGRLTQVNPSGYVGIQFSRVEMPDGTIEKIDGSSMDLKFGPLKGYVSGKKRGTKFLVRSLTGLGTVASYLVGPTGSHSTNLISSNTLLRERLAENVATAGQEELNSLAFNQNIVVTVPGNTRFYIVVQKPSSNHGEGTPGTRSTSVTTTGFNGGVPTLEELRQLMQLKREMNELYTQTSTQMMSPPQH